MTRLDMNGKGKDMVRDKGRFLRRRWLKRRWNAQFRRWKTRCFGVTARQDHRSLTRGGVSPERSYRTVGTTKPRSGVGAASPRLPFPDVSLADTAGNALGTHNGPRPLYLVHRPGVPAG
jgi:hypothetical protein